MNRRWRRRSVVGQINVLPFVDVMLVLLLVFMVTAPLLVQGLAVDLPRTRTVDAVPTGADHVVLTFRADGVMYLDQTLVTEDGLPEALRASALAPGRAVYLRADGDMPYGRLAALLDLLKGLGLTRINLVTETGREEPETTRTPDAGNHRDGG